MPFPKLSKKSTSTAKSGNQKQKPPKTGAKAAKGKKVEKVQKCLRSPICCAVVSLLAVIFLAAAITATIMLLMKPEIPQVAALSKNETETSVCKTPDCLALSHQMHQWQNSTAKPCEDFYAFACGQYDKQSNDRNPLEAKKTSIRTAVKKFIKSEKPQTNTKTEQIMRTLYATCKDERRNNPYQMMRDAFAEIKKHTIFPLMDANWAESKFDMNKALTLMATVGVIDFGLFSVQYHETALEKRLLVTKPNVKSSPLDLPVCLRSNVPNQSGKIPTEQLVETFLSTDSSLVPMLFPAGSPGGGPSSYLRSEFDNANSLWNKLLNMPNSQSPSSQSPKTLTDLDGAVSRIKFTNVFHAYLDSPKMDSLVSVDPGSFFFDPTNNLNTALDPTKVNMRDVANLLFFQLLRSELFRKDFSFMSKRSMDCADPVINKMQSASVLYYEQNIMKRENRKIVSELIEDVRNSYLEMFKKNTWMEESTRKAAIEKVEKMTKIVGYGEEYEAKDVLDQMYKDFLTSGAMQGSFFDMSYGLKQLEIKYIMQYALSKSTFNRELGIFDKDAYYSWNKNQLNMFIQSFDDPIFNPNWPKFAQIASIGRTIAHEMGHAFDTSGKRFNANGEPFNWWTSNDNTKFDEKAKCFEKHYEDFVDPNEPVRPPAVNGILTDYLGMQAAWKTYKKLDSSKHSKLPGFENKNADQLFWQIAALPFCENRESSQEQTMGKGHPFNRYRVNGIYQNMKEFADTFQCPPGEVMNLSPKCELF